MFNDRFRALRKQFGYSQEQMARKLHVTQGAISQWETGATMPAADQLIAMADIFETSVDKLLGREENQEDFVPPPDIDEELITMITSLPIDKAQRLKDFVLGLKAADKQ